MEHDMDFASDDNRWRTWICYKRSVAPMRFLSGINDKHHKANHDSIMASIMKSIWLGFTFESGVGAPFRPTCFDGYTVHFARTTQTDTLYSVQELSNCPTRSCCLTTILRLGRLYMEYDMDFASDDDRWQKIWPPTPSNISTRTSFIAISNLTTSSWALESVEIRSMSSIVPWPQDPFSHTLPREQESHRNCALHLYQIGTTRIHTSHSDSGVGASFRPTCFDWYSVHFARTTQTDTLYYD